MKLYTLLSIFLTFVLLQLPSGVSANSKSVTSLMTNPYYRDGVKALPNSPLVFIENIGQFKEHDRFQIWGSTTTVWLSENELRFIIPQPTQTIRSDGDYLIKDRQETISNHRQHVSLKLSFVNSNPHVRLEPFSRLDAHMSYLIGNNPNEWHTDVPVWGGVRYVDLYPGIDLKIISENGQIVQRLVAKTDANLQEVRLRIDGADTLSLESQSLRLATPAGDLSLPLLQVVTEAGLPFSGIEQEPSLRGNEISSPFAVKTSAGTDTELADLNTAGPSDLLYSTFLGGSSVDTAYDVTVDGNGAAYITGSTVSANFPTTSGAFDTTYNANFDTFVAKLNADGTGLIYATYLGGSGLDEGYSIAVDASGSAYVTGSTQSMDFPTTAGAFDTSFSGSTTKAFIVKLNATGSTRVYSTYLGGSRDDWGYGIAVDGTGHAYVTGRTLSTNFPVTPGAFQTTLSGVETYDAFVAKINPSGDGLVYATYLGGVQPEWAYDIAVDTTGSAYVTGLSASSDFPTTPGAFRTTGQGTFVTKVNSIGSGLVYSSFLCTCLINTFANLLDCCLWANRPECARGAIRTLYGIRRTEFKWLTAVILYPIWGIYQRKAFGEGIVDSRI